MESIGQFLSEVRLEFSKIVWPKFDELVGSVLVVLFLVVIFAIYLGFIDFVFYSIAQYIF